MDESGEALSVDGTDEESGGHSPENWTEGAGNRRLKLEAKEDRISGLLDSLIQQIISYLPSTKQAIQTGILSKRWLNQWSRVPILIFDSTGKNNENFSQFIDRTLVMHDCSKLKKFEIQYDDHLKIDPQLTPKIRFATRKHVEELILHLCCIDEDEEIVFILPEFLLYNDSLVKLELFNCYMDYEWSPNWPSLKELKLECSYLEFGFRVIELQSGCPLLELLELTNIKFYLDDDVIASKSLKRLIIRVAEIDEDGSCIEISCPNLEVLTITVCEKSDFDDFEQTRLQYQKIENVLSTCPLLHTLELMSVNCSDQFVIASNSLKKLVLGELPQTSDVEILCPNLEESNLLYFKAAALSSDSLEMKLLGQLQYVKVLEIGSSFLMLLSALEVEGQSSVALNCRCLSINGANFDDLLPGIVCAIRSSPLLEELAIKFPPHGGPKKLPYGSEEWRSIISWWHYAATHRCTYIDNGLNCSFWFHKWKGQSALTFQFIVLFNLASDELNHFRGVGTNCHRQTISVEKTSFSRVLYSKSGVSYFAG